MAGVRRGDMDLLRAMVAKDGGRVTFTDDPKVEKWEKIVAQWIDTPKAGWKDFMKAKAQVRSLMGLPLSPELETIYTPAMAAAADHSRGMPIQMAAMRLTGANEPFKIHSLPNPPKVTVPQWASGSTGRGRGRRLTQVVQNPTPGSTTAGLPQFAPVWTPGGVITSHRGRGRAYYERLWTRVADTEDKPETSGRATHRHLSHPRVSFQPAPLDQQGQVKQRRQPYNDPRELYEGWPLVLAALEERRQPYQAAAAYKQMVRQAVFIDDAPLTQQRLDRLEAANLAE
jgi:hypothetical protein